MVWFHSSLRGEEPLITHHTGHAHHYCQCTGMGPRSHSVLGQDKHVSDVSATYFGHPCQNSSSTPGTASALVLAFATARFDYCNAVLTESSRVTTDINSSKE